MADQVKLPREYPINEKRKVNKYERKLANELIRQGFPAFRLNLLWDKPNTKREVDIAFDDWPVVVECQGGQFIPGGGGHNRGGAALESDYEKFRTLYHRGWRCLPYTTQHIERDVTGVAEDIRQHLVEVGCEAMDREKTIDAALADGAEEVEGIPLV